MAKVIKLCIHGKPSRYWYADIPAGESITGKRRRVCLKRTKKAAAQIRLGEILRDWEAGRESKHVYRAEPQLWGLVDKYIAHLERQKRGAQHVGDVRHRLGEIVKRIQWLKDLEDIDLIHRVVFDQIASEIPGKSGGKLTTRTQLFYLRALNGFAKYLVQTRVLGANVIPLVPRPHEPQWEYRHREALTIEEVETLVEGVPLYRGVTYLMASTTGLRRSELRSIPERDVNLEAGTIRIRSKSAKNKREHRIPLSGWTSDVLRRYLGTVRPESIVRAGNKRVGPRGFRLLVAMPSMPTYYRDLERTLGLCRVTTGCSCELRHQDPGSWIDFHSLRHSFATWLLQQGVSLAVATDLMRHSTPELLKQRYAHLVDGDYRKGIDAAIQKPGQ